ncbi:hypothetical protein ACKWTF_011890 [Chironomus riparius]
MKALFIILLCLVFIQFVVTQHNFNYRRPQNGKPFSTKAPTNSKTNYKNSNNNSNKNDGRNVMKIEESPTEEGSNVEELTTEGTTE